MKSGTVAVVGKANAGKSTLLNVIVGEKVAIVSPKPQTTRDRILGVLNNENYQIVFEDTPGFYKSKTELSRKMQRTAKRTAKDVDVVLFVLDAHEGIKEDDLDILKSVVTSEVPTIVALSKIDIPRAGGDFTPSARCIRHTDFTRRGLIDIFLIRQQFTADVARACFYPQRASVTAL